MEPETKPKRNYQLEYYYKHREERLAAQKVFRRNKANLKKIAYAKSIMEQFPSHFVKA